MSCVNHELKSIFIHVAKCAGSSLSSLTWNKGCGHKTYIEYAKDISDIEKYFTWSVVRNPWDRAVSAYEDAIKLHPTVNTFKKFIEILYTHKDLFRTAQCVKESDFIKIPGVGVNRIHFLPAHLCLQDENGCMKCTFVGRFENLQEDFRYVCNKLNIQADTLPFKNSRKQKEDRNNTFYKDLYTDSLLNQVGEIYKKDISIFGYDY